jgi:hypothetical protein
MYETAAAHAFVASGTVLYGPAAARRYWNAGWLNSVSKIVGNFATEDSHGAGVQAGRNRPQSGIYTITHDPVHAEMPHEVAVIKGRRFPTCRHCKGISFQLAHPARHISEIEHLEEEHATAS